MSLRIFFSKQYIYIYIYIYMFLKVCTQTNALNKTISHGLSWVLKTSSHRSSLYTWQETGGQTIREAWNSSKKEFPLAWSKNVNRDGAEIQKSHKQWKLDWRTTFHLLRIQMALKIYRRLPASIKTGLRLRISEAILLLRDWVWVYSDEGSRGPPADESEWGRVKRRKREIELEGGCEKRDGETREERKKSW